MSGDVPSPDPSHGPLPHAPTRPGAIEDRLTHMAPKGVKWRVEYGRTLAVDMGDGNVVPSEPVYTITADMTGSSGGLYATWRQQYPTNAFKREHDVAPMLRAITERAAIEMAQGMRLHANRLIEHANRIVRQARTNTRERNTTQ